MYNYLEDIIKKVYNKIIFIILGHIFVNIICYFLKFEVVGVLAQIFSLFFIGRLIFTKIRFNRVKRYGNFSEICDKFNSEIEMGDYCETKQIVITPSFIVSRSTECAFILPLSNLVWVHMAVEKRSVNFIKFYEANKICIYSIDGRKYTFSYKTGYLKFGPNCRIIDKSLYQGILSLIYQYSDSTFFGYIPEIVHSWKSNKRRKILIEEFEKRKLK